MTMGQNGMAMRMGVRLLPVPGEVMVMTMVFVVHMPMCVVKRLMGVLE